MKANYSNGKIYKIVPTVEHLENEVYIGSTTKQYLSQRMNNHRRNYNGWTNGKCKKVMVYELFEKYGVENCKIILLEYYSCSSKDELTSREGHYILSTKCINKHVAGRTQQEC